ncbi:MAG: MBG domain-containing protein, partial [Pirellulales bacterium]
NDGTLTVNSAPLTVDVADATKTYGQDDSALLTGTITGIQNGDPISAAYTSVGSSASAAVGTYSIAASLSDAVTGNLSNYSVTINPGTLTINTYAFTYTIGNDLQAEGFPANLTADLPGAIAGVNGQTLDIAYASIGDTAAALPGQYPITGTLSNGTGLMSNYTVTLKPGVLTVAGSGAAVVGNALYLVGGDTNDSVSINPVGSSGTGSTGIELDARLGGVRIDDRVYSQSFNMIYVIGFGGNDHIDFAPTLTIPTVVIEGDGNDHVRLGDGRNTVTVGSGNDNIEAGDGNNVIVAGGGNDQIQVGDGDNLVVGGMGHTNVAAGNGNNILIDGSVSQSTDQLWAVLDQWMADIQNVDAASAIASDLENGLTIQYNTTNGNRLGAGSGFDAFFATYAKDNLNAKPGDLVNGVVVAPPAGGHGHTH